MLTFTIQVLPDKALEVNWTIQYSQVIDEKNKKVEDIMIHNSLTLNS